MCNELSEPAPPTQPTTDERILDAARDCVVEFGVKRTTLAEVARRAGVSRPTVYRRWPDTRTLIAELLFQEITRTIDAAAPHNATARERLVAGVLDGVAAIGASPLFDKLFRTDSDVLLAYIVERLGRSQRSLIAWFTDQIEQGQADGSVRAGDPAELATMVLLIAQSCVQSARIVAEALPPPRLHHELARALTAYLHPGAAR